MEMPHESHVVLDALFEYVLEYCCLYGCPWVRYERCHVDRGELLQLLSKMVSVSTKTHEDAAYSVQLAALWLASHDVQLMKGSLSPAQAMSHVLEEFDINMDIFSKDWNVETPIPEHLCRSRLHELSAGELRHLRNMLYGGWNEEIVAQRGVGESQSPRRWLTPAHRN